MSERCANWYQCSIHHSPNLFPGQTLGTEEKLGHEVHVYRTHNVHTWRQWYGKVSCAVLEHWWTSSGHSPMLMSQTGIWKPHDHEPSCIFYIHVMYNVCKLTRDQLPPSFLFKYGAWALETSGLSARNNLPSLSIKVSGIESFSSMGYSKVLKFDNVTAQLRNKMLVNRA